jgi:hypothetical protein
MFRDKQLNEIAALPSPILSIYINTRSENASRAAERNWLRIPVYKVPLNLLREFQLSVLFFLSLARAK